MNGKAKFLQRGLNLGGIQPLFAGGSENGYAGFGKTPEIQVNRHINKLSLVAEFGQRCYFAFLARDVFLDVLTSGQQSRKGSSSKPQVFLVIGTHIPQNT